MEIKFCNYLVEIGLIEENSSKQLNSIYKDISSNSNNNNNKKVKSQSFKDLICSSFFYFIQNLTVGQKHFMSYNIPMKFLEKYENQKKQKIKKIIEKKCITESSNPLKYFALWRKNIFNINEESKKSLFTI